VFFFFSFSSLPFSPSVPQYYSLVRYLQTIQPTEKEVIAEAKEEAVKAASLAIKLPEIQQCDDILEISAIKQLETDQTHSRLYQLLKLFACDKLDDFVSFNEKNPDYLNSIGSSSAILSKKKKTNSSFLHSFIFLLLGISHDESLKKIRLLSLATLAVDHQELPYSLVSKTLSIEETEVEQWVILAISADLIDAKLDQLKKLIIVRSFHSHFPRIPPSLPQSDLFFQQSCDSTRVHDCTMEPTA